MKNKDYSDKACIRSCALRTVILTGVEAGEEKRWSPYKVDRGARSWKKLFFLNGTSGQVRTQGSPEGDVQAVYVDKRGDKPAYASIGIPWVEQGTWNGQKAHFLLLRVQHHRGAAHYLQRVEFDVRVWKAGDALQSIAKRSHEPLSSISPPAAIELSAAAPEIALYGPRAAVGRPEGTPVDCFWDGHFQPGDRWRYFAELGTPPQGAYVQPTGRDVWSVLQTVSYGDYDLTEPAHDFDMGIVVISDGKPFDLTAYSSSYFAGRDAVHQYLWTPYEPARINGSMRVLPKPQRPLKIDFGSQEMKVKWKELVDWSKPYDTVCRSQQMQAFD